MTTDDTTDLLAKFRRVDETETSTLFCRCGAWYEWSGFEGDPNQWAKAHEPHVSLYERLVRAGKCERHCFHAFSRERLVSVAAGLFFCCRDGCKTILVDADPTTPREEKTHGGPLFGPGCLPEAIEPTKRGAAQ